MKCSHCGMDVTQNQRFCATCGNPVSPNSFSDHKTQSQNLGLPITGLVLTLLGGLGCGISDKWIEIQTSIGKEVGGGFASLLISILVVIIGMVCAGIAVGSHKGEGFKLACTALLLGGICLLGWIGALIQGFLS